MFYKSLKIKESKGAREALCFYYRRMGWSEWTGRGDRKPLGKRRNL